MNLNYYPICPNPKLTVGVGGHSDVSTLTALLQDETGGLYVKKLDGENWVHLLPVKGSLTINIGDALQIMSNGRYKSIEHHVVTNKHENRISVPIFVNPRPNDVIGPLPEVIKRGEKALYIMSSIFTRNLIMGRILSILRRLNHDHMYFEKTISNNDASLVKVL
nr:feruloyl CoA ortho-hydroxylase 1-like [Tanacetum cinerariifolium]